MAMPPRRYRYIGPPEIRQRARRESHCLHVTSVAGLLQLLGLVQRMPDGPRDELGVSVTLDLANKDGFHAAFAAPSREAVARFYEAALRLGGRDNGAPELCPEYGPHYFAAFVIDPDGYRIEAVINEPA